MAMSITAKAAWPLLWTECDDHGMFEWKPIVLKARLFPADNINFADLLAEFERLDCIKKVEVEGKPYGIVRNFCRYQRPKNPSYKHPFSPELAEYVSFKDKDSPSPPPVLPQSGVKSPADGVGEGVEEGEGKKESLTGREAPEVSRVSNPPSSDHPVWWPTRDRYGRITSDVTEKVTYDVGKAVLGRAAGGQVTKLRKLYHGDLRAVTDLLMQAEEKGDASEWIAGVIRKGEQGSPVYPKHEVFPESVYR